MNEDIWIFLFIFITVLIVMLYGLFFSRDAIVKSYLIQDANFSSGFLDDQTNTLKAYLDSHDKDSEGLFGMIKIFRYREGVLEEDEILTVVGKGHWLKKNQFKFNIPAERILLIIMIETIRFILQMILSDQ